MSGTVSALLMLPILAVPALAAAQAPNTLTADEKRAGWTLLFDGTSMDQWRGYKKPDTAGLRWVVKDGCLALPPSDGSDTRGARDIITKQQFDDFELAWEWKVWPGSNSGVKYFVIEEGDAAIGHEYQIIDDRKHADAQLREGRRSTGAFYDVLPARGAAPKPVGEFNQSRIVARGNHVEHWLNGTKILEYTLDTNELRAKIADSKFKDRTGFDKHPRGHLLLQDHGDAVCYRNIKVRELKSES